MINLLTITITILILITNLEPLSAAKSAVNLARVVARDSARQDVDKDECGQHVPGLERPDEPHHAEK